MFPPGHLSHKETTRVTTRAPNRNIVGSVFMSLKSVQIIYFSLSNPKTKGLSDSHDTWTQYSPAYLSIDINM